MDTQFQNDLTDAQLDERDDRVRAAIKSRLSANYQELRELEEQANVLRRENTRIIALVTQGQWSGLQGLLSRADIESLSNIEPVDRVGAYIED